MQNQKAERTCTSCGAVTNANSSFCTSCGALLVDEIQFEPLPSFSETPQPETPVPLQEHLPDWSAFAAPGNAPQQSAFIGDAQSESFGQKRCSWCNTMNPSTNAVCQQCGAHFPIPEQDEALRRASEQRLLTEEAQLESLRERRWRKRFWLGGRWRMPS